MKITDGLRIIVAVQYYVGQYSQCQHRWCVTTHIYSYHPHVCSSMVICSTAAIAILATAYCETYLFGHSSNVIASVA